MVISEGIGTTPEQKKPHILVVDDIAEVAQEVLSILEENGFTATATTPDRFTQTLKIMREQPAALVSDLRFVGRPGGFDNGLALAQRFPGDGGLVFLTASIGEKSLGQVHTQGALPDGRTAFRGALKGEKHIPNFLAQVRGALRDAREVTSEERIAHLQKVTLPEFNSGEFSKELENIIAIVAEKLKIYTSTIRAVLKTLTDKHSLADWTSWQQYQHIFETQLDYFASCDSHKICGNSDRDAMDTLHELRSRITLLDPSRITPPGESNKEAITLLGALGREHQKITHTLHKAYENGDSICHPQFDFDKDVAHIIGKGSVYMGDIYYSSRNLQGKTKFRDTNRLITSFFEAINTTFGGGYCSIDIRRVDEDGIGWDGSDDQKKLQDKLNWGGGYSISIRILGEMYIGKTNEQIIDAMRGVIQKLLDAKKIYFNPRQLSCIYDEDDINTFDLLLKTEELDRDVLQKKIEQSAMIQTKKIGTMYSWCGNEIEVSQVDTPAGAATILGVNHGIEKMQKLSGDWSGIVYEGEVIMARTSGGHCANDEAIFYYLAKRKGLAIDDAFQIAQNAVRMKSSDDTMLVEHEKKSEEDLVVMQEALDSMGRPNFYPMKNTLVTFMTPIVKELGINNIILSLEDFFRRSTLDWMIREEYAHPKMSQLKEDKWFE